MIHRILLTLALLLVFTSGIAQAQKRNAQPKPGVSEATLALYEPGEYQELKYRLMKPIDFDPAKTYPMILSLHGAGGRGTQNIKNLRNWNEYLADETLRRKHPCFVLAPQSNGAWNDPTSLLVDKPDLSDEGIAKLPNAYRDRIDRYRDRLSGEPTGNLHLVLALIDNRLTKEFHIDTDRIYCIGHSMGGAGTFTTVYQHPGRFAAAIPTSGSFYPWRDASRLADVPIWTFHGSTDNVVPTDFTRHTFAMVKEVGGNMKYTELEGVGHGANEIAFHYTGDDSAEGQVTHHASDRTDKTEDIWDWLFGYKLSDRK